MPTFHLVKVLDAGAAGVEELSPVELPDQGHGRLGVLAVLGQDLVQLQEHEPGTDAAKLEIGAQDGGGGLQTIG